MRNHFNNRFITIFFPGQRTLSYWLDSDKPVNEVLEIVFAQCNHGSGQECPMFLQENLRSLSVNDCVAVDDQYFQCKSVGWEEVNKDYPWDLDEMVRNHPEYKSQEDAWFVLSRIMMK
jgi:hypothetical protein